MAPIEYDQRKRKTRVADDILTPAEIAEIIRNDPAGEFQYELRSMLEAGQAPTSYVRQAWSDHALYYTANRGARSLVVAFCSAVNRLGVPVSYFLQTLRDDLYDVLVLQDPRKLHFTHGVAGLGSFMDVIRKVEAHAQTNGFTEIITYGSSMGGFPALRAGILLDATRAISMSGGFCWHISRLGKGNTSIGAFDVLCPCFTPRSTELVAVVPARNEKDVRHIEMLRQRCPDCVVLKVNSEGHTLPAFFLRARLLRLFHACLFEYWNDIAVRTSLLSLVEDAAIHQNFVEAKSAQQRAELRELATRQAEEIKAIHASTSWRLTQPLRRLVEFLRSYGKSSDS